MGKKKASVRLILSRRPNVNSESEDEDAVEGMTIDTGDNSSLSLDPDEEATGSSDALESLDGDSDSDDEESIPGEVDASPPQTEKPKGIPPLSLPPPKARQFGSKPKPKFPSSSRVATPQFPTPQGGSSTNGKHTSTPSQPRTPGSVSVHRVPAKSAPLPKASGSISPPKNATEPRKTTGSPGTNHQGGPPGPVNVSSRPKNDVAAEKNTGPSQVSKAGTSEKDTHLGSGSTPEGSPERSPPARLCKSDIESLYASPSPEKTLAELEPIELDSDPDFELMEQMLLSHRGPSSQSKPIKKESTAQPPAPSQSLGLLKRRRSNPSLHGSSQAPTREPPSDSQPAKRPRIKEPRSSDSMTALDDRRRHPEFWDLDGTVVLQVDNVLFRVMRSALSKASPWFQRLFDEDFDHLEVMAGCHVYVIEEDLSQLDFANLLRGLENGLEYALNPPHYLRTLSIFRAASLLEFGTLRRWSLGCLEKQWAADLPPPSKPSKFGSMIPWAKETLAIANLLDIPHLTKRAYWELCTRSEFGGIDAEAYDDEVEEIMPTRSRLPRSVILDLTRVRERLLPEWTRITRTPPVDVPCDRAMGVSSPSATQSTPCCLDYASWNKVILEVEVNDMTIDDKRMDPISALEVMIVEIDWEKEGGFCAGCVRVWKSIWTKDREKIWKNLGSWLELDVASGS